MAQATLTINADGSGALSTIASIQNALNNLQQQAQNIQIGGNGNGGNGGNAQINQMSDGIARLTLLTNSWAAAITRTVATALRSAYQEITNIDDQMVVIRRVSNRTGAELDALTNKANRVAKTYGIAASDYLASVANFSKAGYGQAADALGELSVKAQRVGDISQSVADQFLLAVDKGYQFNGSIEQLTAVLDGANEIGNKFATDIDQIAAGLGKVAPIASQAHVSIYELEAALGTITAVTQRSGTEAATALRALFLNIMGDTKTEIEDGAKWTAGEIEGLQDLLKIYASDVVEAAQKTGEVINPMEAIAALSKAFREGVLTEQALVSMVSDIGGKLRTTQLLALIQNWDMYTKMLDTAKQATGSADKEIANSMDSITVKVEQFKATWVDMVSKTTSSRFIKNTLDFTKGLLEDFGDLKGVLMGISGILLTLRGSSITQAFRDVFNGIRAGGLNSVLTGLGVLTTAITGIMMLTNNSAKRGLNQLTSLAETASDAASASDSIYDLYMSVQNATPGTDEYAAALARLGAQMEAIGGSAKGLAEDIQGVTEAQLENLRVTASAQYNEIGELFSRNGILSGNPLTSWDTHWGIFAGNYRFNVNNLNSAIRNVIEENMSGLSLGGGTYGLSRITDNTLSFKNADQLITTYESLLNTRNEIRNLVEKGIVDNTNNSVYSSEYYQDITSMLNVLSESYTQARTALDSVISTTSNLRKAEFQTSEYAKAWKELNNQITDGGEASDTKRQAAMKDMVNFVNSFDDGTLLGKAVKDNMIRMLAEQFPQLAAGIREWQDVMSQTTSNGVAETANDAAAAAKALVDALSAATKAKNEFDAAMAQKAENSDFQDYKQAYDAYAAEIEEGRVNSRTMHAAAKYLLGEEAYNAAMASGGYKAVAAAMKSGNFDLLYGEKAGEYGEGMISFMKKYANAAGEIVDANGNVIASMKQTSDGIHFEINDYQALAEKTGLSIHQIGAAFRALGVYGEVLTPQMTALKETLSEFGDEVASIGEDGVMSVNYDTLKRMMTPEQLASDNWKMFKQYLNLANELGEINLKNVTEGWLEADDAAERAAKSAEKAKETTEETAETAPAAVEEVADDIDAVTGAAEKASDAVERLNGELGNAGTGGENGSGFGEGISGTVEEWLYNAITEMLSNPELVSALQNPGDFLSKALQDWTVEAIKTLISNPEMLSALQNPGDFLSKALQDWTVDAIKTLISNPEMLSALQNPGDFLSKALQDWTVDAIKTLLGNPGIVSALQDMGDFATQVGEAISQWVTDTINTVLKPFGIQIGGGQGGEEGQGSQGYVNSAAAHDEYWAGKSDEEKAVNGLTEAYEELGDAAKDAAASTSYVLPDSSETQAILDNAEAITAEAEAQEQLNDAKSDASALKLSEPGQEPQGFINSASTHAEYWKEKNATTEVKIEGTGDAKEISDIVGANGKTIKVKADIKAEGDAEDVTQALAGEEDKSVIEKEVHVTLSDDSREALGNIINTDFDNAQEVTVSFNVQMNEQGQQIVSMIQSGTINGVPTEITTTFTIEGDGTAQIEEIKSDLDGIQKTYSASVNVNTSGEGKLSQLKSAIDSISDKTVTVTANTNDNTSQGSGSSTTTGGSIFSGIAKALGFGANAKGSEYFAGGLSLVNEEGPELIAADGWAKILGNGEPTIGNIPRGAKIYTAQETAQILGSAYKGQTRFPAFAEGTGGDILGKWASNLMNYAAKVADSAKAVASASGSVKLPNSSGSQAPVGVIPEKSGEWTGVNPNGTTAAKELQTEEEDKKFWDTIQKYIEYGLLKIQYQIDERQEAIDALEKERDRLFKPLDRDISDFNWEIEEAQYRITLLERSRDDATKGLKEQIEALKEARDIEQDEEELEEKRLAVIEAENALKDAQYDRTVRYYNEASGQWEWMADKDAVKRAEDALKEAQEDYEDALADWEITQLERQVDAIEKMYGEQMKPYETTVEQFSRKVEDLQYQRDKIDKQYADSINPLSDAMEEIQDTYDKLQKYYTRVQDAVSVPTDDLNAALAEMSRAETAYSSQVSNVKTLLDQLYALAPTWSAVTVGSLGVNTSTALDQNSLAGNNSSGIGGRNLRAEMEDYYGSGTQVININGLTVKGDGEMSLNELMDKAGIYRNNSR